MSGTPRPENQKRSTILINPRFQLMLIAYTFFITLIVLASVYFLVNYGFHEFETMGFQAGFNADHVYFNFIQLQADLFNRVLAAIGIVVTLILVIGGLILSHKVAGPIDRFHKELMKMAHSEDSELKPVNFRKGDFFPELPEAFNLLVRKVKGSKKP